MPSPESDLERAARKFRAALLSHDRAVSRAMIDAYGQSWRRIRVQLETLNSHIAQARAAGVRVSAQWLYQQNRLATLKQQVEQEVAGFARYAGAQIGEGQAVAVDMARAHAEQLAMAGLGPPPPGVNLNWDRLPREAVSDLVGALHNGSPLASLLAELGPTASKAVSDALIVGVATGLGPREVARIIRRDVGMSLVRALKISRTEILRSYREATRRNYQANSDVVKGWIWHSALDRRSCACCWAMHGTNHGLDEKLDDHVNGRCAMIPWTSSWTDILGKKGQDIPDTRPQMETGASRFGKLSDADKEAILGKAAFQAYKAGAVKLEDFVGRSFSKRWGSMRSARSLQEILGPNEAAKYLAPVRREAAFMAAETKRLTTLQQEGEAITKIERSIRSLKREHLCVVNSDGQVLLERVGELDRVGITDADLSLFRGNTVIHNHTDETSFSRSDIRILLTSKAKQFRVATNDWTYVLDLPEDTEWLDVEDLVGTIRDQVSQVHQEAIRRGILTLDESDSVYWHNVWEGIAEIRGWQYKRYRIE